MDAGEVREQGIRDSMQGNKAKKLLANLGAFGHANYSFPGAILADFDC